MTPSMKPGVVLDLGGVHERASGCHGACEDHRAQLGTCGIDRGGVAGRTRTDDDDVVDHDSSDSPALTGVTGSGVTASRVRTNDEKQIFPKTLLFKSDL